MAQAVPTTEDRVRVQRSSFSFRGGEENLGIIGQLLPGSAMAQAVPTAEDRVRVQRGPFGIKLHWDGVFSGYFVFLQSVLHHCHPRGGQ